MARVQIKIEYINPFIIATVETVSTMCNIKPFRNGDLFLRKEAIVDLEEVVGVIGLAGGIKGAVLMSMKMEMALKLVSAFLMEEISEPNADLTDGFGEIVNIIAGAAAGKLSGLNMKLALPTVVIGEKKKLYAKQSTPWIVVPMQIAEWGNFTIEVSINEE